MPLQGFDQANFLMANGVFLADGYSMNPNFVYMMMMYQINEVTNMNFANPTAASKIINDWSAANTNNLIRELISPGMYSRRYPSISSPPIFSVFSLLSSFGSFFHTLLAIPC